jgi:cation transport ATPase
VMVITCPHALGLAVPLVVAVSTALAARNGLLVRNRADFERARALDAVVFDKTGTLTEGRFGVSAVATAEGIDEREAVRLAAGVEQGSQHPIGRGILDYARQQDIDPAHASDHQSIPGRGARAEADGRSLLVVGQLYLDEHDIAAQSADVVLVRSDPRDLVAVLDLAGATRRKMVQNLWWAAGYNIAAIPLAAGVLAPVGVLLSPAVGALLMSASTVIVAVNARLLGRTRLGPDADA